MKTYSNISFPSKVRFRKKVHSQTSDHVWFFLNSFSKRPREKKEKKERKKKRKREEKKGKKSKVIKMWHVYGDTRTQWVKAEQLVLR